MEKKTFTSSMVKIKSKNSIDNICLNDKYLGGYIYLNKYYIETNKDNEIVTISVRLLKEFVFDGQIININNFNEFINKNQVIVSENIYVFPKLNLSIFISFEKEIFLEILIYSNSVSNHYNKNNSNNMNFIPYKQIGKYKFGQNTSEFSIKENVSHKYFINKDEYILRFDNGVFTQLYVDLALFKEQILLEDKNLNNAKELGLIVENEATIERKAHWVIPEIGLAVSKKFDELYFFDKTLLDKWSLIHRPITSW